MTPKQCSPPPPIPFKCSVPFDIVWQRLLHSMIFFGGKTKSPCFDLFIHWLLKQIKNTYRNHFLRSYENRSIPNGNVCSISSKPSLILVPGSFSKWFTVQLVCTNGKRDSEPNFTSPEFCVPFAQAEDRLVNNQGNPLNFLVKD